MKGQLRAILNAVVIPPLFVAATALVVIGLKDSDLLVAIVKRLIVVAVPVGIPVMLLKIIALPRKKENGRR